MNIFGFEFNRNVKTPIVETKMEFHSYGDYYTNGRGSDLLSKPWIETYSGNGYVRFGPGNLFPQEIDSLYNTSGLHSAIIDFKKNLICGNGFELKGSELLDPMKKVELSQFINFISGDGDLNNLLLEITLDWLLHNTVYLKLYWNSTKSKLIKVERLQPSSVRLNPDPTNPSKILKYSYSFDWREYGRYQVKEYPNFNRSDKEQKVEVIRYVKKNPETKFYTLPDYIPGKEWIQLDGNIGNFHNSNLKNSVNPGMIFQFHKIPDTREDQRSIIKSVQDAIGPERTGKPTILWANGPENAPTITPVATSNLDKQFIVTGEQASLNICYSHKISPSVMGLPVPKGFGDGDIDISFEIFNKQSIQPEQRQIEAIINGLLSMSGIGSTFVLNEVELYTKKEEVIEKVLGFIQ